MFAGVLSADWATLPVYPGKLAAHVAGLVTFKHLGTLQIVQTQFMPGHGPTRLGRGVLLLLVCLIVFAQSAALSGEFESHHATEHCCLLCHVGALPFLQVTVASALAPVFRKVWLAPPAEFSLLHDSAHVIRSSRAPPSSAALA
jgi:hypothetical protein